MTDRQPLTYTFDLPEAEQVRASRILTNRHWVTRLMYAICGGIPLLVVLAGPLLGIPIDWARIAPLVVLLLTMLVLTYFMPNLTVRRMRKDLPIHAGPHQWTLIPGDRLATVSPGASSSFAWPLVRQAIESREFYLVYVTPTFALVLPKRAVGDSEQALREFLRAELGTRARLSG